MVKPRLRRSNRIASQSRPNRPQSGPHEDVIISSDSDPSSDSESSAAPSANSSDSMTEAGEFDFHVPHLIEPTTRAALQLMQTFETPDWTDRYSKRLQKRILPMKVHDDTTLVLLNVRENFYYYFASIG